MIVYCLMCDDTFYNTGSSLIDIYLNELEAYNEAKKRNKEEYTKAYYVDDREVIA